MENVNNEENKTENVEKIEEKIVEVCEETLTMDITDDMYCGDINSEVV